MVTLCVVICRRVWICIHSTRCTQQQTLCFKGMRLVKVLVYQEVESNLVTVIFV